MARIGFLIAIFCISLMLPSFEAQAAVVKCNSAANCKVAEAQSECQGFDVSDNLQIVRVTTRECIRRGESSAATGYFFLRYKGVNSDGNEVGWFGSETFYYRNNCPTEGTYTGVGPWSSGGSARNGSLGCRNGCDGIWQTNADSSKTWSPTGDLCPENEENNCKAFGDGYYWNSLLKVCEPPEGQCPGGTKPNSIGHCAPEPCPDGMISQPDGTCKKKENECPAGQVRSPDGSCLPGDGQCAAGEVRGPDGTCKRDSDNDGEPDEHGPDDQETFTGGDDCNSPPSCSGSPILCGQARIQWRIECNTRRNRNIAGGTCNAMPICTGEKCDAMEYAGLLMQWRTACAAEKLAAQGSGGGESGQPEWTKVGSMSTDLAAGSSPDDTKVLTVKTMSMNDLDQSGIGGSGSCMGFASGGGQGMASGFVDTFSSPPAFFCNYIGQIKALIILLAACGAAVILARGGA